MKKSAFISDILLTFFLVGVFTLCLFRYCRLGLRLAVFLAALCGVLGASAIAALLQNKRRKFFLKKSDETQKQKLLLHLALLSDEKKTKFFLPLLAQENNSAKTFGKTYIYTPDSLFAVKFRLSPVCADEIAAFARIKSNKNKILLCSQIEESANTLCHQLNIGVKSGNDVYKFVKENNALPEKFLGEIQPTEKRKKQWRLCFSKNNSKRFLISGALILFTALYTPFAFYYLVFGSILLLVALFIRIFGYE